MKEIDFGESNNLIDNVNFDEEQQFKVSKSNIKYLNDIAEMRNGKIKSIYEQTLHAKKLTNDIQELTKMQDEKIGSIHNNIEDVVYNSKETYKNLLKTSDDEKAAKDNKCWLIALGIVGITFLIIILIHMGR